MKKVAKFVLLLTLTGASYAQSPRRLSPVSVTMSSEVKATIISEEKASFHAETYASPVNLDDSAAIRMNAYYEQKRREKRNAGGGMGFAVFQMNLLNIRF